MGRSFDVRVLTDVHELPSVDRRGRQWRRFTAGLCAALLAFQVGCYSYLPVRDTPPDPGQNVGITLNDRGRQLAGGRLGADAERIDGILLSATESAVTVSVNRVRSMRGSNSIWAGEQVEIPREGIRGFQERQLSKGRTAMLTVGLVVGAVAIASLISLTVGGNGRSELPPLCPPDCGPNPQ